jgi:hypothetical protein
MGSGAKYGVYLPDTNAGDRQVNPPPGEGYEDTTVFDFTVPLRQWQYSIAFQSLP